MSTATKLTLGSLDASKIKRLVITRRSGGVRIMKAKANVAKFIREHADDELASYPDRLASVQSGSDYRSLVVNIEIQ